MERELVALVVGHPSRREYSLKNRRSHISRIPVCSLQRSTLLVALSRYIQWSSFHLLEITFRHAATVKHSAWTGSSATDRTGSGSVNIRKHMLRITGMKSTCGGTRTDKVCRASIGHPGPSSAKPSVQHPCDNPGDIIQQATG